MPSDTRTLEALNAIAPLVDAYQQRVATFADRVRSFLAADETEPFDRSSSDQLGEYAAGRIDLERFNALWSERELLDESEHSALSRVVVMLREIATLPRDQFLFELPTGGHLSGALLNAFADFGRGFGAMVIAELVRTRRFTDDDIEMIHGFPRFRWSRSERASSPPVVIGVDGADLWAGEVAQYLDGNQKIVFVVRGPAPPAPLVRLITPGTLVIQTTGIEGLAPLLKSEGAAVAALLPEGAAEFTHIPGPAPMHERLTIVSRPQGARKPVEAWSIWQQQQELEQLYALAAAPVAKPSIDAAPKTVDPADRLASWLLSQAQP